jgi:hypothetical protein
MRRQSAVLSLAIAPMLLLNAPTRAAGVGPTDTIDETPPVAVDSTWNLDGGGDWQVDTNWIADTIPNGTDDTANFDSAITANHTVFTDDAVTLGILNFDNTFTYVLAGTSSLTMQVSSGSAQVNVGSSGGSVQTQEINLPLSIASNTIFNVFTTGSELLIADPITINSGISVTTTGSGSVVYDSLITLNSEASLTIGNSTFANTLSLASSSTATVSPHGANPTSLLQLNNLSFGGSVGGHWQGKLDLSDNDMVVHGGSLTNITDQIAQGRNSGTSPWTGSNGITSSLAAADPTTMALGVEVNDNGHGAALVSTFDGQPVSDGDILVKFTLVGDTNLDGVINASDYLAIDNGFQNDMTGWQNGDFNYDGVINGDDYTLIDNAYNTQTPSMESIAAGPTEMIAVPEPGALGMLGFGLAMLARRRRRPSLISAN